MKTIKAITTLLLSLACASSLAQNYKVTDFEESLRDLISTNVKDENGHNCAIIKFSTEDQGFSVDEAIDESDLKGDLYVYLPEGTEVITIRHRVHRTLTYHLPLHMQSGCHYKAVIDIIDKKLIGRVDPTQFLYAEAGMNILPFMGPSVTIGYKMRNLSAELGFTYGLNKTDDLYFYDMGATIKSAYKYQAVRAALRIGYSLPLTRSQQISLTPQAGVAYNIITGKEVKGVAATNSSYMDGFNTLSATIGAKLAFNFSGRMGLSITPEYDFGISSDESYDTVKKADDKLKNWTDGFCLTAALVYKF